MNTSSPHRLAEAARAAAAKGDRPAAAKLWSELLKQDPDHTEALSAVGNWLLAQGDAHRALNLLGHAVKLQPREPALQFNLAAAARAVGDLNRALAALDQALILDPYFVHAIFQKAVLFEDMGKLPAAARFYRDFLDVAPQEVLGMPQFQPAIARARAAIAGDSQALAQQIGRNRDDPSAPSRRLQEGVDALLRTGKIYTAQPTFFTIPRLPAVPFLDRALTPWIEELEASAALVAEEARRVIAEDQDEASSFTPYVATPPGQPANQFAELNRSPKWGAFFFWKHGERYAENCARCPATSALLDRMPLIQLAGRGPNAFFSLLKPHTRIPPHTGVTNARCTVHLPLVVPDGCGFRVGAETRQWVPGTAWVFDDTIEHEAWNDSDQQRLILIFDVWNPYLDDVERAYVGDLLDAYDRHYGRTPDMNDAL